MAKYDVTKTDRTKYDAQGNEIMGGTYTDPVHDMFSAEEVHAAENGEWGSSGTPAAGYNADQVQQGQALQDSHAAQGQALQDSHAAEGQNLQDKHQNQGAAAIAKYGDAARQAGQVGTSEASNAIDRANAASGRTAPTTNYGDANRAGAGTEATLAALNRFAANDNGSAPSAAQAQLQSATNQGLNQQLALAASGRGMGGSAAATGQAQSGMASISANAANESAQLRAQETAAAKQRQLTALSTSLGGGLGLQNQYGNQAQFNTQTSLEQQRQNDATSLANNQLALANNQFGVNAGLGYGGLAEQTNLQQQQLGEGSNLQHQQLGEGSNLQHQQLGEGSNIQHEQLGQHALDQQAQYELQQQQMAIDAAKANQTADLEKDSGIIGMAGSLIGGVAGLSDERSKKEIARLEHVTSALSSALGNDNDALDTVKGAQAYSYKYKNPSQPGAKAGHMVGPMAQDLEKGPLGDTVVEQTPQGKMVNTGRLTMVNSSAIAEQQKQLDALKRSLGGAA